MFPVFASLVIHGKIASHDCRSFGWDRGALLAGADTSTDSTSTGTSAHRFLGAGAAVDCVLLGDVVETEEVVFLAAGVSRTGMTSVAQASLH